MELTKAIELLKLYEHAGSSIPRDDFLDAIKLVINATRKLQYIRILFPTLMPGLLPGEDPIFDNTRSLHTIKKVLESPLGRECGQ